MIPVFRVPISRDQFRTLPSDERALILLMGHALNQIAVLVKLVTFSTNKDPEDAIEGRVSAAQSQIILRFLFGTLVETWELMRRPNNQKIIGRYLSVLDREGTDCYQKLREHFGRSNLFYKLRNSFSYHYPSVEQIEEGFEAIPQDDEGLPWEWYLSETNTNSFYFSCEMTMGFGVIMQVQGEPHAMAAFGKVLREAIQIANAIQHFLMPLMKAMLVKHFGPTIFDLQAGTTIADAPGLYEFWIPFFAEPPADVSDGTEQRGKQERLL
jgi:hypothetical protein